jgi:hypothetical protein
MIRNARRGSAWYLIAIWSLAAVAIAALVLAVAGCNLTSRAEQCKDKGGVVEKEWESKKGSTPAHWEYECVVNGEEVDEWR